MQPRQEKNEFYGIQVLRGVAAFLVVVAHVGIALRYYGFVEIPISDFGASGVHIFFVISGFVMMVTTRSNWRDDGSWYRFVVKRIKRIVPLYWILTTAKIVIAACLPAALRAKTITPSNAFLSYLFIPSYNAVHVVSPVISAGWTLCYEMCFYFLFAGVLLLRKNPLYYVSALLIFLFGIGLLRHDNWGAQATLLSPFLLEFAFGMWIAEILVFSRYHPRRTALLGMLVVGTAGLVGIGTNVGAHQSLHILVCGVLAALITFSIVGLEDFVP